MGLKVTYNQQEFYHSLDKTYEDAVKDFVKGMATLGKKVVDIVVADANFTNRKGILRSSIGCGVFFNGVQQVRYGFFTTFGPESGAAEGIKLLEEIGSRNVVRGQIKLVVVAGADYASFVEAKENYRVLETGERFMDENINSILRSLNYIAND